MSLVLDFIHGAENAAVGTARLPVQFAENYSNEFANIGNRAAGRQDQTIQQNEGGNPVSNAALGFSQATGTNRQFASDIAQVGVYAGAGALTGPAGEVGAGLTDAAETTSGKVAGGLIKGGLEGAAVGGAQGLAQGIGTAKSAKDLSLDFLQGAGLGAVLGGATGSLGAGVKSAQPLNEAGGINNPIKPSDQFSQEDLQKMANNDDPKAVAKQLEPVTGKVVAQQIAPSIAKSTDPNVAANIIDNSINNKLPAAVPNEQTLGQLQSATQPQYLTDFENAHNSGDTATEQSIAAAHPDDTRLNINPSPAPAPLPAPTPVSDINTPTQVAEQGSDEASLFASGAQQQEPTTNDLLNHFSTLRNQAGSDEDFYNNTILNNQETPGKVGQLSRSIARNVEGHGADISDELNDQLAPLTKDDLAGTNGVDKEAQLNDLKQTARKLEVDTGQKGLYSNLAKNMVDMSQDEQIAYLSEGLKNARDSGAMAAAHLGAQAAPTTEEPSFMHAPGEVPPQSSQVSKAGTMNEMQNILNQGGTTDEALNHYFQTQSGAAPGEAQNALDQVIHSEGIDKSKINASLNPQYPNVDIPKATSKDAAVLNGNYANNKVVQAGAPALQAMQDLNDHDLNLVRSLRGRDPALVINQANDPEQFAKVVSSLKDYNDYTQAAGAQLGQDIPYRQNYGLRTPYNAPEEAPVGTPNATLPENPSYAKQRIYNTHEEAIANGEVPRFADAKEDLANDIQQRSHDQSQLALAQGLEQAYPGQVKIINDGQIPSGYRQLLIPNGDKIFMPSDLANKINERQMANQSTGALGKYDAINAAGKNLELGGGLFHGFNTGGIFAGQQLASGKLFTNPSALGNVVKNTLSDSATNDYADEIRREGTFDENHSILNAADAAGLNYKDASSDIGKPEDTGLVGKIASIPGLKQIHQSIFERQIPTMMMETFRQKTQGLDIFGSADDREQAIKIAKGINQEYGHLNRDIQGLTPKQFKLASRGLLAADYQEGQLKTLGAAFDPRNFGTPEGRLAREAVFGKALVFGGLATLGGLAGGDFKNQNAKQVALAIMNKAINPSFDIAGYKVGLPATQISNVAKPVEQSVASAKEGKGIATGAENFASSHAAFIPSKAEEFSTNKNYEGNAVYGKDYFGRPISPGTVAENAVSGVLPIPLAQTAQTATGGQSTGAAIANTIGLNASPQYNLNYAPIAGQTHIQQLQATPGITKQQIRADTQFFDLLGEGSKGKSKTVTAAEKAIIAKNPQKANQIIADYNKQLIQKLLPWEQSGGSNYLDPTMLQLLRTAEVTYKKANENVSYDVKTNPTAYGVPIQALATSPGGSQ